MSRQSSPDMPDAPEVAPSSKSRKDKPWVLWHKWPPRARHPGLIRWHRLGRYRTRDEAELVAGNYVRRVYGNSPKHREQQAGHHFRVLRESQGKPE